MLEMTIFIFLSIDVKNQCMYNIIYYTKIFPRKILIFIRNICSLAYFYVATGKEKIECSQTCKTNIIPNYYTIKSIMGAY